MAYQLVVPLTVKFHDVFHLLLLNKYVKDVDHVSGWPVFQVELEGKFSSKPLQIL